MQSPELELRDRRCTAGNGSGNGCENPTAGLPADRLPREGAGDSGRFSPTGTSLRSDFTFSHVPALDGLRGVAILVVMLFHAGAPLSSGGHLGVDIFFVLSGFLITGLLVREWNATGGICFRSFYARRALRLLPALYLLLAVAAVYTFVTGPRPLSLKDWSPILLSAVHLSNWARALGFAEWTGDLGHTWSLAIEEQFYLLWPVVLWVLLSFAVPARRIAGGLVVAAVVVAAWRIAVWQQDLSSWDRVYRLYNGLDTRLDSLLVGSLIAILTGCGLLSESRRVKGVLRAGSLAAAGVLIVMLVRLDWFSPRLYLGGLTLSAVCTATLLLALLAREAEWLRRPLEFPLLMWTGRISYGLYLWHAPIFHLMKDAPLPAPALEGLRWSLSLIAAVLSYQLVEQPCLRLKERFRSPASAGLHASRESATAAEPEAACASAVAVVQHPGHASA